MKSLLAAFTIALTLSAGAASAHTGGTHAYPVIGTPAYDASCTIVDEGDDFVRAYCREDGETYLFDFDGNFYYVGEPGTVGSGIKFWIRPEGSWFVAPERWQIGPGATIPAR